MDGNLGFFGDDGVLKILISGRCELKNAGNPGSLVAQGPTFPGVVGVVLQLPSMEEPGFLLEQPLQVGL